VYWRRRAVVLGALALVIIVLFVQCSGGGDDKKQGKGAGSTGSSAPASAPPSGPVEPSPSFLDNTGNAGGPSLPAPGDIESQPPANTDGGADGAGNPSALPTLGSGQNNTVGAPTGSTCADSEIKLIPQPSTATLQRTRSLQITLTIKNVGSRTCSRDVGAGPQELYIDMGARKYWSSDTCSTDKGSDVRQLNPGATLTYNRTWNGRQSSSCTGGSPSGPNPPAGQYQLHARLGTLFSDPVPLTIQS
jgi:archaellum component FlaG (FlaF/FlaG flagellin family)